MGHFVMRGGHAIEGGVHGLLGRDTWQRGRLTHAPAVRHCSVAES